MKFAHLATSPLAPSRLAVIKNDTAYFTDELIENAPRDLQDLISWGEHRYRGVHQELSDLITPKTTGHNINSLYFSSAVTRPPAILAIGLNYSEHAHELKIDTNNSPVLFSLFPNSLTGHKREINIPTHLSTEVDYEAELGVIIGKKAKNITKEKALDYVFGYTVVNDLTARNLQFQEPQWSRCKSFDGFTPTGPVVVTKDEIPDPQDLWITTIVDDLKVQDAPTSQMIRDVATLISAISQETTLLPGTLISTGSPGGAGRSRNPALYLMPGTRVSVSIDKIGELTNYCVGEMPENS